MVRETMASVQKSFIDQPGSARLPWSFHIFRLSPFGAALTGVILCLMLLTLLVVIEVVSGRPQRMLEGLSPAEVGCEWLLHDYRISIVGVFILIHAMTARYILSRWTYGAALALSDSDFDDAESLLANSRWGFLPGLTGAFVVLVLGIDMAKQEIEMTSEYWNLPHTFNWLWCVPAGWIGGQFIFALVRDAVLISRRAQEIEVRDLSERGPLDIAVKHGSRSTLLSLMFLGVASVHIFDPGMGPVSAVVLVMLIAVGAVFSIVPPLGVIHRMYDFRDAQLERLTRQISLGQQQLANSESSYNPGRIGDMVALEQHLKNWKVNVLHLSNFARFFLYSALGFVSWLSAAGISIAVENMLGL